MGTLLLAAPLALSAIGVALLFFRFRDNFSDLAAATDGKQSNGFWTIVALIYVVIIAVLYSVFHHGRIPGKLH